MRSYIDPVASRIVFPNGSKSKQNRGGKWKNEFYLKMKTEFPRTLIPRSESMVHFIFAHFSPFLGKFVSPWSIDFREKSTLREKYFFIETFHIV